MTIDASCTFSTEPGSPRRARQFARETLAGNVSEATLNDAMLIVSELVTNAIVHGHSEGRLRVTADHGAVQIRVSDAAPAMPQMRDPGPSATSGRGLRIVDALSRAWGVDPQPAAGKAVWVELADRTG